MKYQSLLVIPFLVLAATQGFAAGDLSRNSPQEVVLEMGTKDGRMYFKPKHLEFETGKAYKILLKTRIVSSTRLKQQSLSRRFLLARSK